jgi:hypothetical protein
MTQPQQVLLALLTDPKVLYSKNNLVQYVGMTEMALSSFSPGEFAEFYVEIGFLQSVLVFLKEQHWLQKKKNPEIEICFFDFVGAYLAVELSPLGFLHGFLQSSSIKETAILTKKAVCIELSILKLIKLKSFAEQKIFFTEVLKLISNLFEFENQLQEKLLLRGEHLGLSLYRTYDSLDVLFNLDYLADWQMKVDKNNSERLYEGSGVGVQSGYSTLLTALRYLQPSPGARIVDLGSGYGRMGLVIGLLRPDIDFKGYEYVRHRVVVSMAAVTNLSMQTHVKIYTQDLSLKEFLIPDADIYYLYDPFSADTYQHVLKQLVLVSHRQKITIVTKGNARSRLLEVAQCRGWPPPEEFYSGNLCFFKSSNTLANLTLS